MGGESKSDSSQETSNTDNRVGAADEGVAVGANSEIRIEEIDPGLVEFGSEVLDFGKTLAQMAESSTAQAGATADRAISYAETQTKPAEGRSTRLMMTVSVAALAAYTIAQVAK